MSSLYVEIPARLSASKEGSWAYRTVKDRMPAILVTVIDTLHKEKDRLNKEFSSEGSSQLKEVVGRLSKLRYEIMTNKPLGRVEDKLPDASIWNSFIDELNKNEGSPCWFQSSWLYVECLMYRQIVSACHQSKLLASFDPFSPSKIKSYQTSQEAIGLVVAYLNSQVASPPSPADMKAVMKQFLELSLWGNKCDLSISAGQDNSQTSNPLKQLGKLDEYILVDDYDSLWTYLLALKDRASGQGDGKVRIDLVLDNAGFELLVDICLGEMLISLGFATQVVFHMKSYPWFVSDTTDNDVRYSLGRLQESKLLVERTQGSQWVTRVNDGSFVFKKDTFWTLPHDFAAMRAKSPDLYTQLASSQLIIFKGDLNYRKLMGDREWPCETTFDHALLEFNPAPLLTLRTLKSEVCVGLAPGMAQKLNKAGKDWMVSGDYAVLQFTQLVLPLNLPSCEDGSNDGKHRVTIQSATTSIE